MCHRTRNLAGGPGICHLSNCPFQRLLLKSYRLPRRIRRRLAQFYLQHVQNGDIETVLTAELRASEYR